MTRWLVDGILCKCQKKVQFQPQSRLIRLPHLQEVVVDSVGRFLVIRPPPFQQWPFSTVLSCPFVAASQLKKKAGSCWAMAKQ